MDILFSKLKDRTQDFVFVKQSCLLIDSSWGSVWTKVGFAVYQTD